MAATGLALPDSGQVLKLVYDGTTEALQVNVVASSGAGQLLQYTRNGVTTVATIDTSTATNNRPAPIVVLAGDSAAPLDVGTGAAAATTRRVVTSSDSVINQAGVWNITNISGTISLPTGASTSALQTTGNTSLSTIATQLTLAIGSTTSGQTGNLILGAVTTAAPSYTTAQSNPLSLTTVGNLRVDGSSVTQPVSGTIVAGGKAIKGSNLYSYSAVGTGAYVSISLTTSGAGTELTAWDTSGVGMDLGFDPAGGTTYVRCCYVPPGGAISIPVTVASGSTFAVKSTSGTVSSGQIAVAVYG